MDKGFGKTVKWDIPMLEGYQSEFIRNHSWKPSIHKGFFGLINLGVIRKLYKEPSSVVIVHGWAYCTHILAILFGRLFGHTICLRAETPLNQELKKNRYLTFLKHIYLRFLFLFINKFLYIGSQNKAFYQSLGISESKLVFAPYCVDNDRFRRIYQSTGKAEARNSLKLEPHKKIILYSGKYISKKRPIDLLKAFNMAGEAGAQLVFVGDGELRAEMEVYIAANGLADNVILTGFINQAQIPFYYRASDLFVMCSGQGETWGLSVNEAMNFGLPVIVSDTSGCAHDLVVEGQTGAVFETGNIKQLAELIHTYLHIGENRRMEMLTATFKKIGEYNYDRVIAGIETITGY